MMFNEVAELPSDIGATVNDVVDVIPHDCVKGELTVITKRLP